MSIRVSLKPRDHCGSRARGRGWDEAKREIAIIKSRLALLVLAATLSSPRLAIAQAEPTRLITDAEINRAVDADSTALQPATLQWQ